MAIIDAEPVFEVDLLVYSWSDLEEQFAQADRMTELEAACHRQIVVGRLCAGYYQWKCLILSGRVINPSPRGVQETYLNYFDRVDRVIRPGRLLPHLTRLESLIIYTAMGVRNADVKQKLLLGYRDRPVTYGLRACASKVLESFEARLADLNLPGWTDLPEFIEAALDWAERNDGNSSSDGNDSGRSDVDMRG